MVVDDTPENLTILRMMLSDAGYRVLAFPNGRMALQAALKTPPDLILLDVMMPEMDGYAVCERLKVEETLCDIPVLFLSALSEVSDKVKAFEAGGVDYITKPFRMEEVLARVNTHIELAMQRRALQRAYDRLRELESLRDDLVHMIVHDMRSHLMAVDGAFAVIWEERDALDSETRELLALSMSSSRELIEMVNSLLDTSRLEAGRMPLRRTPCDIDQSIRNVIKGVAILARQKSLSLQYDGDLAKVNCDQTIVERVLTNIMVNAIKFTPSSGSVTVRTHLQGDCVRVEVADNGPGIPMEYQSRIFDKFVQVEMRHQGIKHSTGLGLTFCKLAVEAHGGQIGVQDNPGGGSMFWFALPVD